MLKSKGLAKMRGLFIGKKGQYFIIDKRWEIEDRMVKKERG
jgi:hypothetical protein